MYTPPFHRRILPWLYIAIFLVTAPLLIFYTAGYRYNSKKHQIERSGTLIVDTFPKGARVSLDGRDTQEVSPITFQNIPPGWHEVRLTKNGYFPWQSTLDIRAEQVTFANNLWLWRQSTPLFLRSGDFTSIHTDPRDEYAALFDARASSSVFGLWTEESGWRTQGNIDQLPSSSKPIVRWRDDGQALVINGFHPNDKTWWSSATLTPSLDVLPNGLYYWSQDDLVGNSSDREFRLDPDRNTFIRRALSTSTVSTDEDLTIQTTSTSPNLLLTYKAFQTRVFSLPFGDWRIAGLRASFALLKDGQHWLAVALNEREPSMTSIRGDEPRWLEESTVPRALFIDGHELWEWTLGQEPTLLWRQSEPLVQTAWHRSGTAAFVATTKGIFALTVDNRTHPSTVQLASFDQIKTFDVLGKTLLVSGTKDGVQGLWSLLVE